MCPLWAHRTQESNLEEMGGLATVLSFPLALGTAHQPSAELVRRMKVPEGWEE